MTKGDSKKLKQYIMKTSDQINNIISQPIIKGKRPIYYLITEEKLNDLIQNGFIGNIFFVLFSILVGGSIAEKNIFYAILGVIFLLFSAYFYYFRIIGFFNKTKRSGEIRSLEFEENENDKLIIVKAIYGTFPDKTIDITKNIIDKMSNGKLSFEVLNSEIANGSDPDKGAIKSLEIEYKIGNQIIKRSFKEYEQVELP